MRRTHTFQNPYFVVEVPVTAAFCVFVVIYSGYMLYRGDYPVPASLGILLIAAVYQFWNLVVSHAYPQHVYVDDDSITFELWGRENRYDLAELQEFHVRSNAQNGKTFVRAGQTNIFKGRYWIATKKYTDGDALFETLDAIEIAVHPDSLKARARNYDKTYMERADEIAEVRKKKSHKKGAKAHNAALGTKAQGRS